MARRYFGFTLLSHMPDEIILNADHLPLIKIIPWQIILKLIGHKKGEQCNISRNLFLEF